MSFHPPHPFLIFASVNNKKVFDIVYIFLSIADNVKIDRQNNFIENLGFTEKFIEQNY